MTLHLRVAVETVRTQHIEGETNFTQEIKDMEMFKIQWISTKYIKVDVFTRNLGGPEYNNFCRWLHGTDNYYKCNGRNKKYTSFRLWEGVVQEQSTHSLGMREYLQSVSNIRKYLQMLQSGIL